MISPQWMPELCVGIIPQHAGKRQSCEIPEVPAFQSGYDSKCALTSDFGYRVSHPRHPPYFHHIGGNILKGLS
jgi:hypothetical protein